MIEFFTISHFTNNLNNLKKKENDKILNLFNNENDVFECDLKKCISSCDNMYYINIICSIITIIVSIYTAYLADKCYSNKNAILRVFVVIFAFFFPFIYLVYYFITHILLKIKC